MPIYKMLEINAKGSPEEETLYVTDPNKTPSEFEKEIKPPD